MDLKRGATFQDKASNAVYKYKWDETWTLVKLIDKKVNTLKVPDTITVNGKKMKVTSISKGALHGNSSIKKLTVGKNVSVIGASAFQNCDRLTEVTGMKGVVRIDQSAFSGDIKLKKVALGAGLQKINNFAFSGCSVLEKVTVPAKLTTIGKQAFKGCKKLKTIIIKSGSLTAKTVGSNAFSGTPTKTTVWVPKEKVKEYKALLVKKGLGKKAAVKG